MPAVMSRARQVGRGVDEWAPQFTAVYKLVGSGNPTFSARTITVIPG